MKSIQPTLSASIPLSHSGPKAGVTERCLWASCIKLAFLFKKCLWLLTCLHTGSSVDALYASEGLVNCPCQFQDNTPTVFSPRYPLRPTVQITEALSVNNLRTQSTSALASPTTVWIPVCLCFLGHPQSGHLQSFPKDARIGNKNSVLVIRRCLSAKLCYPHGDKGGIHIRNDG